MTRALAEIESLSDEMRRCAGQGDWEAVGAALTARDGLVRELLAGPPAADHADPLRRLLEQDGEILAMARKARDAVAAELRQLDNGRKAVHAYGGQNRQSRRSIANAANSLDPTEA
ncbi:flagellar protein FliT [Lentisalinibacter sediminis]|uniref:flagellar protein FliT n=1 Tax=Lentisalinibacter sediminis TaxID=2992237 RepID=UPI00386A7AD3